MGTEINETENRERGKINKIKRQLFKKINKTDKTSWTNQLKKERTKNYKYREREHITTDNMNIKRMTGLEGRIRANCKWA